jgi:hypothetical protein
VHIRFGGSGGAEHLGSFLHVLIQLHITQQGSLHPGVCEHLIGSDAGRGVHRQHTIDQIYIAVIDICETSKVR